MPKTKPTLTDLANPVRHYTCKDGRQIPYKPLTLRNLAEIEAQHGAIIPFLQRALEGGEITPMLALIEIAVKNADPSLEPADLFLAGDFRDDGDAANLLLAILRDSGLIQESNDPKNDALPNPTGQASTPSPSSTV